MKIEELIEEFHKVEQMQIEIEKKLGLTQSELDDVITDLFCSALSKGFETDIQKPEGKKTFMLVFEAFQKGLQIGMNSELN